MAVEVTFEPDEDAFVARVDGERAGLLEARRGDDGRWVLPHTEVDEAFGGQGVAGALARATFDHVRAVGEQVVPTCSFVLGWLEKHPEEQDLVAS